MGTTPNALAVQPKQSALWESFGRKYEIEASQVMTVLRDTILKVKKDDPAPSNAEVAAFIVVCNQYDLNPFTKEIFGFIAKGKMQYVVSVDGWSTLLNRQPNMNGVEFEEHFKNDAVTAITCKIHRKDRTLPTVITEYFSECKGSSDTWSKWPIRMLRHKALIQCARLAFGLAGVMDEDEAERMGGFVAPQFIEASAENQGQPSEADAIMSRLGWAPGRKNQALKAYEGQPENLLSYLRGEEAKMKPKGKTAKPAPQTIQGESRPENPSSAPSATTQEQHTMDAEPVGQVQTADEEGRYNFSDSHEQPSKQSDFGNF